MVKIEVFCGVARDRCDVDKKYTFWRIMYSSARRVFWLPDSIRWDLIGGFFVGGAIGNFFHGARTNWALLSLCAFCQVAHACAGGGIFWARVDWLEGVCHYGKMSIPFLPTGEKRG